MRRDERVEWRERARERKQHARRRDARGHILVGEPHSLQAASARLEERDGERRARVCSVVSAGIMPDREHANQAEGR
jgi:hypothetical protein